MAGPESGQRDLRVETTLRRLRPQGWDILHLQITTNQVNLPVDKPQKDHAGIARDGEYDTVRIRKLIPRCIDFPGVGITGVNDLPSANPLRRYPGREAGNTWLHSLVQSRYAPLEVIVVCTRIMPRMVSGKYVLWDYEIIVTEPAQNHSHGFFR